MLQITILWYSVFTFLCAFAQNFEQLFVLRALHGLRLRRRMGGRRGADGRGDPRQIPRPRRRHRADRLGDRLGRLGPRLHRALLPFCPRRSPGASCSRSASCRQPSSSGSAAISRSPKSSAIAQRQRPSVGFAHLFAAFRGPHLWTTVKVTLMVAGAQGGGYALGIWMPTYLRTVRGLSATSTGGFLLVQILGALFGFLLGSYLSDAIGRKWTFLVVGDRVVRHDPDLHVRADGQHGAAVCRRSRCSPSS